MMKNKIITTLFLILSIHLFYSQNLIFKDENFEKAVVENFDLNKDGAVNQFEADNVENLFLVKKGINITDDLSYFKNAKMIVMDDNIIPNISLKNMDNLLLFSCTRCKISNFEANNLKNLASLYLNNNKIENILLKDTPRIDQLTLSINKIKTIDLLSLTYLRRLNLEHNQLLKLDISTNMNLETLNMMNNPLKEKDIKKGAANVTIFGFQQW